MNPAKPAHKILAVLQARTSSTRLPGKVLMPLLGKPMILRQVERISRSKHIERLVVATSADPSDDQLAELCASVGVAVFRGQLEDVLDRFYQAARSHAPSHVIRLTGDCPLIDPDVIDQIVEFCLAQGLDYASNTIVPTFPDGLDVEIMTFPSLQAAWTEATLPSQREHVTPYIHQNPQRFRTGNFKGEANLSQMRWTVDEPADFELVKAVYGALYPSKPDFSTPEIIRFLENNPELLALNTGFERNEGYKRSLQKESSGS